METSKQFVTSVAECLQSLVNNGVVDFDHWLSVTGQLHIHLDTGHSTRCVIDERLSRSESGVSVSSNSVVDPENQQQQADVKEEEEEAPQGKASEICSFAKLNAFFTYYNTI